MSDLTTRIQRYADDLISSYSDVTVDEVMAVRRVPTRFHPVLVAAAAALIVLAVIGGAALLLGHPDTPVIEPSTTLPAPTTTIAPTTTSAPTTTTEPTTTTSVVESIVHWTRIDAAGLASTGSQEVNGIARFGDDLYLVGNDTDSEWEQTTGAIWRSTDGGTSWERIPDPDAVFKNGEYTNVNALATNGDVLVAVGSAIWISSDGTVWERVSAERGIRTIVATDTGFVAAGEKIWTSPDGVTWNVVLDLWADAVQISDLIVADEGLLAVGTSYAMFAEPVVMLSTSGLEWTVVPDDDIRSYDQVGILNAVEPIPSGFVAVGQSSQDATGGPTGGDAAVWTSASGGNIWTQSERDLPNLGGGRGEVMADVVAFDNVLVAVGYEMGTNWENATGVVWESTDGGATWIRVADPDEVFGEYYAGWSLISDVIRYGDTLIAAGSVTGDAAAWIGRK